MFIPRQHPLDRFVSHRHNGRQPPCRAHRAKKLLGNGSVAEVLVALPDVLAAENGQTYTAQAVGAETPLGQWQAWIEFIPLDGGPSAASPRETTQPNRAAAVYWATGLTAIYLEGALARALGGNGGRADAAARSRNAATRVPANRHAASTRRTAVLDPFSVYEKGESVLRAELSALASWHLVNIVTAYELSDQREATLNALPPGALIDIIVSGVRA
jgi:hypothetical protein